MRSTSWSPPLATRGNASASEAVRLRAPSEERGGRGQLCTNPDSGRLSSCLRLVDGHARRAFSPLKLSHLATAMSTYRGSCPQRVAEPPRPLHLAVRRHSRNSVLVSRLLTYLRAFHPVPPHLRDGTGPAVALRQSQGGSQCVIVSSASSARMRPPAKRVKAWSSTGSSSPACRLP